MAHQVFISYASAEHASADEIRTTLAAQHQITCWVDRHNIPPGTDWVARIGTAIHIPILPCALEDTPTPGLDFLLNATQRFNAWPPPVAAHLPRLAEALQGLMPDTAAAGRRITLLVRRQAEPDWALAEALEQALQAHGHTVWLDRQQRSGLAWARQMEQQVRQAEVALPLLSASAVQAEVLAWMLETASEAAHAQAGRPRLLPIRVQYDAALPETLAQWFDPVQRHLHCAGPEALPVLLPELLRALADPTTLVLAPPPPDPTPPARDDALLHPPGGAMPLDSPLYIARPVDAALATALARRDSIILLTGARQMGKTSLLVRGLQQAQTAVQRVALVDFQQCNAAQLTSIEALYHALGAMLADKLDLETFPSRVWVPDFPPNYNFERYLRREVLGKLDAPLVWGLDEVDRLFSCPFRSEVFGLFRSWHNARASDPNSPWARLTLVLTYATEAHLFIDNLDQSPFNVGTHLPPLADFSLDEVVALNQRYSSPVHHEADLAHLRRWLGGQPYLTSRWLYEMRTQPCDFATLQAQAIREDGPFAGHLKRLLLLLSQDERLSEAVRQVLRERPCSDRHSWERLRSAGVLVGATPEQARLRCELYALYLAHHLLSEVPR